jgi:hypothetical protein
MSAVSRAWEGRGLVSSRTNGGSLARGTPTGWRCEPAFFCLLFFAAAKKSECCPAQGQHKYTDKNARKGQNQTASKKTKSPNRIWITSSTHGRRSQDKTRQDKTWPLTTSTTSRFYKMKGTHRGKRPTPTRNAEAECQCAMRACQTSPIDGEIRTFPMCWRGSQSQNRVRPIR